VLPISTPILATMTLFYAVQHWNSFFPALIYLSDRKQYPLTLFLREVAVVGGFGGSSVGSPDAGPEQLTAYEVEGQYDAAQEVWQGGYLKATQMAFTLITVVPILFVYPFAQRYFVRGITLGSIKG
jgi:putative aldouronate transport system permease protein